MSLRVLLPAVIALVLSACASQSSLSSVRSGSWQEIGVSPNGAVRHAVDTASIRRTGDTVVFRERVSVNNPALEHFAQTPAYKTAVNEWEMNCRQKAYRLLSVEMFDGSGRIVAAHRYADVRFRPVRGGSASERQFDRVCS